jgi:nucleosome assembly protein 1-like 1
MVEARLGTLIGKSSGYIENLPVAIRRRVAGLKGIQKEHAKLEVQFQEEVLELEKKYLTKFAPIYEKRSKIINGLAEPTQQEVEEGEPEEDEKNHTVTEEKPATDAEGGAPAKGVPEFWLSAMKNTISLTDLITPNDEAPLAHLVDIRMEYLDKPGFRLIFEFSPNDFFENKTLSKTYYYQEEMGYGGEYIYDYAEGEKIDWKPMKDLTTKIEQKKQRNKNTKQTRVIRKTVPVDSFFNFFSPPKPSEDDDDVSSDIEDRLELDYQLGEDIKEKLIPHAVDWFTGEALQFEEMDEGDYEEDEDEDEDDEDMSEDHDDEDESEEEVSLCTTFLMLTRTRTTIQRPKNRRPQNASRAKLTRRIKERLIETGIEKEESIASSKLVKLLACLPRVCLGPPRCQPLPS